MANSSSTTSDPLNKQDDTAKEIDIAIVESEFNKHGSGIWVDPLILLHLIQKSLGGFWSSLEGESVAASFVHCMCTSIGGALELYWISENKTYRNCCLANKKF